MADRVARALCTAPVASATSCLTFKLHVIYMYVVCMYLCVCIYVVCMCVCVCMYVICICIYNAPVCSYACIIIILLSLLCNRDCWTTTQTLRRRYNDPDGLLYNRCGVLIRLILCIVTRLVYIIIVIASIV